MKVSVRLIKCFAGPRHDRLHRIWDAIRTYAADVAAVRWFENPGARLRHGECLNRIWDYEWLRRSRYLLLTEHDFLPALADHRWLRAGDADVVAPTYFTRDPATKKILYDSDKAGAWYLLLDKQHCPQDLDFDSQPDPANSLPDQFWLFNRRRVELWLARDCYPDHYGVTYPFGTHLFWSRHLHDDPDLVVAGCRLGDVQAGHDRAVEDWLASQPTNFLRIYHEGA